MSEFKGIEQAIKYTKGKSSYSVFAEAHIRDYLAGYEQALKDSFAPEMLEMLKTLLEEPRIREAMVLSGENSILNDNIKKAKEIIKKATE